MRSIILQLLGNAAINKAKFSTSSFI